ncbi:MAG: hypothetical protein PHE06_08515 [Lachnospiraceae bacterium]|nr:hypothetical protein [Lachnospiraceae bacterium]
MYRLLSMSIAAGVLILFIVLLRWVFAKYLPKRCFVLLGLVVMARLLIPADIPMKYGIAIPVLKVLEPIQKLGAFMDGDAAGTNALSAGTSGADLSADNAAGANADGADASGINADGISASAADASGVNADGISASAANASGIMQTESMYQQKRLIKILRRTAGIPGVTEQASVRPMLLKTVHQKRIL